MLGYMVWCLFGLLFIGIGAAAFRSEEPVGFWANAKTPADKIKDVPAYNRAVGKLWLVFAVLFIMAGLPLLAGQNSPCILLSILGMVILAVAIMMAYSRILSRYTK